MPTHFVRGAFRPGDPGQEGHHRPPGGHRPQHLRRLLRQAATAWRRALCLTHPPSSSPIKTTSLGDPLINAYHALALKLATAGGDGADQGAMPSRSTTCSRAIMKGIGIDLVDFKLEFGQPARRQHRPGRRDQPRHLPLLGRARPAKSWTRIVSAVISAMWRAHIRRSCAVMLGA